MHLAIFGAPGPTGLLLTQQALDAGHHVRALSRHPDDFPIEHPNLTVTHTDATDPEQVNAALEGIDAVASVLGTAYSSHEITVYSDSARAIIDAMTRHGITRLIVTSSSAAAPWTDPSWSWIERNLVHRILDKLGRTLYDDMRRMEHLVATSGLDWTIMRPLGLANMDAPTDYAVAIDHIPGKQTARRDLAAAILDELTDTAHHHQCLAVATTNKSISLPATIWREGIRPNLPGARTARPAQGRAYGLGEHMLLTTYRLNGEAVSTPVWNVVLPDGRIGMWTAAGTGKWKRLRHNSAVTVQACNARGHLTPGSRPIHGTARILDDGPEADHIRATLMGRHKRGVALVKRIARAQGRLKPDQTFGDTIITITPTQEQH